MADSMFKTRVTELFGIEYAIIQGGMFGVSFAELVSAVSNAGGSGIIGPSFATPEELRQEIRKTKSMTDKPFGVNINLFPTARPVKTEDFVDVVVEEGIPVVETSGRSPEPYMERLKKGGVKVLHKVARVKDAVTAERVGADVIAIVGYECRGHPSFGPPGGGKGGGDGGQGRYPGGASARNKRRAGQECMD